MNTNTWVDDVKIKEVEEFDDLGIIITAKRSRLRHYQKIKNKIRSIVAICKRNLRHTGVLLATRIYRTYIVPLVTQSAAVTFTCPEKHTTAGTVKIENKKGLSDCGVTRILEELTEHFFTICSIENYSWPRTMSGIENIAVTLWWCLICMIFYQD